MKKLIITNWITIDGFIAGPMGEMDWILGDQQLSDYEIGMVTAADTMLLGKKTYQDFAQYWPVAPTNPNTQPWEKVYAGHINALHKVVVSHSLQSADWATSELWRELDAAKVSELKARAGAGNILMYGSATIVQQLSNLGLMDEYHLLIHPLILGKGRRLLDNLEGRTSLRLADSETFASGVVKLVYAKA
jgi:dihydrofolate reductase